MSNEEAGYGGGAARRTPRQGVGSSPVGSWITIALAAAALIVGFLILRNINDDGDSSTADPTTETTPGSGSTAQTLPAPIIPEVTTPPAPETIPRVVTGAKVVVANANTVGGSAGDMTAALQAVGYETIKAVDANDSVKASIVYYDAEVTGALEVANSVARDLGGLEVLPVEVPNAPTASGDLGDAGVLVLLGDDQAGKSIEELSGAAAAGGGTVEAPDPATDVPGSAPDSDAEATDEPASTEG
jgi:hypothetical protein